MGNIRQTIIQSIIDERQRQDEKVKAMGWPSTHHPLEWYAILGEEVGEVARAINEGDHEQLLIEFTHVAAVAIACLEQHTASDGDERD